MFHLFSANDIDVRIVIIARALDVFYKILFLKIAPGGFEPPSQAPEASAYFCVLDR